jgi:hypothetical protein
MQRGLLFSATLSMYFRPTGGDDGIDLLADYRGVRIFQGIAPMTNPKHQSLYTMSYRCV